MSSSAGNATPKTENGKEPKKEHGDGDKNELIGLYKKREELLKSLQDLEKQIYNFEESYLEDTQSYGNIVIGWENFNAESNRNRNKNDKKNQPKKIRTQDRIFSYSSKTASDVNPSLKMRDPSEDDVLSDEYPKQKKKKKLWIFGVIFDGQRNIDFFILHGKNSQHFSLDWLKHFAIFNVLLSFVYIVFKLQSGYFASTDVGLRSRIARF